MRRIYLILFVFAAFAMSGAARADFDAGVAAFKKGDFASALREWQAEAEQGNADAANAIGALYDRGLGVKIDHGEAFKWYSQAAAAGHAVAMRNLANLYAMGHGVPYDIAQAKSWYGKAAGLGDAVASQKLALLDHLSQQSADSAAPAALPLAIQGPVIPVKGPRPYVAPRPFGLASNEAPAPATPTPVPLPVTVRAPTSDTSPASPLSASSASGAASPAEIPFQVQSPGKPSGPAIKAAPVPKVNEATLVAPPALSTTPADSPQSVSSLEIAGDKKDSDTLAAPPQQQASLGQPPVLAPSSALASPPGDNWILGQWEGPSLGCPPNGGLEFRPDEADTFLDGRIAIQEKAIYAMDGDKVTVKTKRPDGTVQTYVYRRTAPDRFVIEQVPDSMPQSLIGAEHKKCPV
ncbi:MAG TPA: hypothetical protein VHL08_03435 [Dongiaceae bacterium]|jgi:hypothetical protein|nr:hypothetical protein [Dongiaceae bacterium]